MKTLPELSVDLVITSPAVQQRNSVGNGLKSACGRDFTGIEQSEEYVAMANHRIEEHKAARLWRAA